MNMKMCAKICNECPFSKESAPGWLGPHSVDEILFSQQFETPFSCHKLRKDDSTEQDILNGSLKVCRGFIASASKSSKLFGQNPMFGKHLRVLQAEIKRIEFNQVLDKREFEKHHTLKSE